jgi:hypothetical protein
MLQQIDTVIAFSVVILMLSLIVTAVVQVIDAALPPGSEDVRVSTESATPSNESSTKREPSQFRNSAILSAQAGEICCTLAALYLANESIWLQLRRR